MQLLILLQVDAVSLFYFMNDKNRFVKPHLYRNKMRPEACNIRFRGATFPVLPTLYSSVFKRGLSPIHVCNLHTVLKPCAVTIQTRLFSVLHIQNFEGQWREHRRYHQIEKKVCSLYPSIRLTQNLLSSFFKYLQPSDSVWLLERERFFKKERIYSRKI